MNKDLTKYNTQYPTYIASKRLVILQDLMLDLLLFVVDDTVTVYIDR